MNSLKSALLAVSLCLISRSAWAIPSNFSFDGRFTNDDDSDSDSDSDIAIDIGNLVSSTGSVTGIAWPKLAKPNPLNCAPDGINIIDWFKNLFRSRQHKRRGCRVSWFDHHDSPKGGGIQTPTSLPEPGTLGLLAFGLVGATWVRRRKST